MIFVDEFIEALELSKNGTSKCPLSNTEENTCMLTDPQSDEENEGDEDMVCLLSPYHSDEDTKDEMVSSLLWLPLVQFLLLSHITTPNPYIVPSHT